LKPQNITIKIGINGDIDGINIIDFGASRFIKNGKAYLILRNSMGFFTELYEGQHISNYLYSGPDISYTSNVKTQLSDIWNIGSIFLQVLTGIPVSILLIINDNHNIEKLEYDEIYKLYKETKIWNPIMFSISLNMYESKEIWSVYLLVEKFLTKFFNSKKNITNSYIPDFIKDLSRCFMFLGKHNESKNRISANELFRSLKKVFSNKEQDSLDNLLSGK
jgi:predicted metallopeptidase